jgi:diaminopimelate decarboxylase
MVPRMKDGSLLMDNRIVEELARERGTPFFLVRERVLRANCRALSDSLSSEGRPALLRYCAKTNNEAGILSFMAALGWHVLVSHPAEARLAIRCGFSPDCAAYQSPVLSKRDVASVLSLGIPMVHAYRPEDIDVLEEAARETGRTVRVSLRLRNEWEGFSLSPLHFLSRRLGFGEEGLLRAAIRIGPSKHLDLVGLNGYVGTNRPRAAHFAPMLRKMARLAARIRSAAGMAVREINIGGGIPALAAGDSAAGDAPKHPDGVPGGAKSGAATLESFAREVAARFLAEASHAGLDPVPSLAAEPGRAVVGSAVLLVTTVRAVHGDWAFLDGSRNYLPELGGILSRPVRVAGAAAPGDPRRYHLSGNTLNTTDILGLRRRLPPLLAGDVLVFGDAGAYSISRGSRYAGLLPPVYLLGEDGTVSCIRRAEDLSDLAGPMILPGSEGGP